MSLRQIAINLLCSRAITDEKFSFATSKGKILGRKRLQRPAVVKTMAGHGTPEFHYRAVDSGVLGFCVLDHRLSADSADNANRPMSYLYEDLSKQIIGAAYKVYNTLGYGYKEKDFQKALAAELSALGFKVTRELYSRLVYQGKVISGFYVDFLVENGDQKIIIELKIAAKIYQKHFYQVLAYLKNNQLPLGLLIVFTDKKVLVKRIINERSAKSAPSANNL